jgi:hypothetical protein
MLISKSKLLLICTGQQPHLVPLLSYRPEARSYLQSQQPLHQHEPLHPQQPLHQHQPLHPHEPLHPQQPLFQDHQPLQEILVRETPLRGTHGQETPHSETPAIETLEGGTPDYGNPVCNTQELGISVQEASGDQRLDQIAPDHVVEDQETLDQIFPDQCILEVTPSTRLQEADQLETRDDSSRDNDKRSVPETPYPHLLSQTSSALETLVRAISHSLAVENPSSEQAVFDGAAAGAPLGEVLDAPVEEVLGAPVEEVLGAPVGEAAEGRPDVISPPPQSKPASPKSLSTSSKGPSHPTGNCPLELMTVSKEQAATISHSMTASDSPDVSFLPISNPLEMNSPRKESFGSINEDVSPRKESLGSINEDVSPRKKSLGSINEDVLPRKESLVSVSDYVSFLPISNALEMDSSRKESFDSPNEAASCQPFSVPSATESPRRESPDQRSSTVSFHPSSTPQEMNSPRSDSLDPLSEAAAFSRQISRLFETADPQHSFSAGHQHPASGLAYRPPLPPIRKPASSPPDHVAEPQPETDPCISPYLIV